MPEAAIEVVSGERYLKATFVDSTLPETFADVSFRQCEFNGLNFGASELEDCAFEHCRFINCEFNSCKAIRVEFLDCLFFEKADEISTTFRFADLKHCRFFNCDLTLADMSRTTLHGTAFEQCQLSGANFTQATNTQLIGRTAELCEMTMTDCNMAYANLTGARFPETDFSTSRMSHVTLDQADLTGALLRDCELHNAEAANVIIKGVDLTGASLSGLDVREVDVTDVTITPGQAITLLETLGMNISMDKSS